MIELCRFCCAAVELAWRVVVVIGLRPCKEPEGPAVGWTARRAAARVSTRAPGSRAPRITRAWRFLAPPAWYNWLPTPLPRKEGAKAVTTVRTVIHDRRIEVPAPVDLADGTEGILTLGTDVVDDGGPMSPAEITRVLAAMERIQPLEIPDDVLITLFAKSEQANLSKAGQNLVATLLREIEKELEAIDREARDGKIKRRR
jgi:hypothetical protein